MFGGGGAQRLAYNLALGIAEQGGHSYAVALRSGGSYSEANNPQVKLVTLGANRQKPFSYIRAFFYLRKFLINEHIDIVHIHGVPSLPFVILATRLMRNRPKVVFTWQDSESVLNKQNWKQKLTIWALHRCDAVSGSSRLVAQKIQDRTGIQQVSVFHGGVPIMPENRKKDGSSPPMIIWLGRIVPPKDPQILIRAAATLRDEGYQFSVSIVGKPIESTVWYMKETVALIEKLGLHDTVRLLGFLSDEELQKLMLQSDISVQTSHTEGLSIALMEHMMFGLAIVATDVGDTAAAIEDKISGLIIPPKDDVQLTDALRKLLKDVNFRNHLSSEARKRAIAQFSIEAMVHRAYQEYELSNSTICIPAQNR
jgi:glycosyltransferase involved in cell wall biosynthesis